MIAANGETAKFLDAHAVPDRSAASCARRKRWDRIVALAGEHGADAADDARSGGARRASWPRRARADPERFPDLSLAVVKLLGAGEYVAERPGEPTRRDTSAWR